MHFVKNPIMFAIFFSIGVLLTLKEFVLAETDDKVVVCYLSSWSVYRPGNGSFAIDKIDPNLCTHIVHAFAGLDITQTAIKSLDPWQDLEDNYGQNGYKRLTELKKTYPHLKVSLAIGGWMEGSKNYSILASDASKRCRFTKQVIQFLRNYNFDGLDLHWKYPTQRGGVSTDRESMILLTKELREELTKFNLILSVALGSTKYLIDHAYNIAQLSQYVDFFHVMTYDYHGHWDNKIGYNAPLKKLNSLDVMNVEYTIDYLIQLGAPTTKLVLGLPFYGRTFQTSLTGNIGDETYGSTFQGPFTTEDGFLGYNEICVELSNKALGWTTSWNSKTSQVIARSKRDRSSGLIKVITFDSTRSIANKVKFAMDKQLAGVMVWSVDTDDFTGQCELPNDTYADYEFNNIGGDLPMPRRSNSSYPLLNVVNEAMVLSLQNMFDIRIL